MVYTPAMRVVVVAGLHRAARLRTVDTLLQSTSRAVAVHHDLSDIDAGKVHRVLRDRWGTLEQGPVNLVHTCASCTLREDLLPFLVNLAREGEQALCVVEAWDGVEPQAIAEVFGCLVDDRPVDDLVSLASVITAVDADLLVADLSSREDMHDRGLDIAEDDDRTVAGVLSRQIEYPTVLTLSAARCGSEAWEETRALLEHLNPAAAIMSCEDERVSALTRGHFDIGAATVRLDPACAQDLPIRQIGRVSTVTWRRTRPMDPHRLHAVLDEVAVIGSRSRGRFWLASRPDTMLVWDAGGGALAIGQAGPWLAALPEAAWDMVPDARRASARIDWHPTVGDRCQSLSFTGIDLDVDRIVGLLDACLLTDEESRSATQQWTAHPDPFAGLLDAVS